MPRHLPRILPRRIGRSPGPVEPHPRPQPAHLACARPDRVHPEWRPRFSGAGKRDPAAHLRHDDCAERGTAPRQVSACGILASQNRTPALIQAPAGVCLTHCAPEICRKHATWHAASPSQFLKSTAGRRRAAGELPARAPCKLRGPDGRAQSRVETERAACYTAQFSSARHRRARTGGCRRSHVAQFRVNPEAAAGISPGGDAPIPQSGEESCQTTRRSRC